ncbi:hypothetical protein CHS0354_008739 [Potamilus streckersoni]|uniref:Uncharacterized protein n=1 Tax=Potamilus streckersoni TaxID=2493646 RepID=A0AAE0T6L0_9BIVA|nr:hypothetical protein CHS0354_008739 [Potamilus streckersoni]
MEVETRMQFHSKIVEKFEMKLLRIMEVHRESINKTESSNQSMQRCEGDGRKISLVLKSIQERGIYIYMECFIKEDLNISSSEID